MNRKSEPLQNLRQLRGATAWQRKPPPATEPIGLVVEGYLSKRDPQFRKAEQIVDAWEHLLPEALSRHCRLAGFAGGVLTVEVSAGPFLHQTQMLGGELLAELKKQCPRSGIRDIRILPGSINRE